MLLFKTLYRASDLHLTFFFRVVELKLCDKITKSVVIQVTYQRLIAAYCQEGDIEGAR